MFAKDSVLIYVCAPLKTYINPGGEVIPLHYNIYRAYKYGQWVRGQGHRPFVPHAIAHKLLDDANPMDRLVGRAMSMSVVRLCDELWQFGNYVSEGMRAELEEAEDCGTLIRRKPADVTDAGTLSLLGFASTCAPTVVDVRPEPTWIDSLERAYESFRSEV